MQGASSRIQRAASKSLSQPEEGGDDGFAWPFVGDVCSEANPLTMGIRAKAICAGVEKVKRVKISTAADDTDDVDDIRFPTTPRISGGKSATVYDRSSAKSGPDDGNDEARIDDMLERLNQLAKLASKATGIRVSFKSDRDSFVSSASVLSRTSSLRSSSASIASRQSACRPSTRRHTRNNTARRTTGQGGRSRIGTYAEEAVRFDSLDLDPERWDAPVRVCPCGNTLLADSVFCRRCGQRAPEVEASRLASVTSQGTSYHESDDRENTRSTLVGDLSSSSAASARPNFARANSMQVMQMIERLTRHIAEPSPRLSSGDESEEWNDEAVATRHLSESNPFFKVSGGRKFNEDKSLRSILAERDAEVKALQDELRDVRATLSAVLAEMAEGASTLVADAEGIARCWLLVIRGTPPVAELLPLRVTESRESSREISPRRSDKSITPRRHEDKNGSRISRGNKALMSVSHQAAGAQ